MTKVSHPYFRGGKGNSPKEFCKLASAKTTDLQAILKSIVMNAKFDNFSDMANILSAKSRIVSDIFSLMGSFNLYSMLSRLSLGKSQGIPSVQLIMGLALFHILGKSIHEVYKANFYDLAKTGKNCYYRLMNRSSMDWRKFWHKPNDNPFVHPSMARNSTNVYSFLSSSGMTLTVPIQSLQHANNSDMLSS